MRGASRGRGFINNRPTLWNPARRQCNTGLSSRAQVCAHLSWLWRAINAGWRNAVPTAPRRNGEIRRCGFHEDSAAAFSSGIFGSHVRFLGVAFLARTNFVNQGKWRVYSYTAVFALRVCQRRVPGRLFVSLTLDRLKRTLR